MFSSVATDFGSWTNSTNPNENIRNIYFLFLLFSNLNYKTKQKGKWTTQLYVNSVFLHLLFNLHSRPDADNNLFGLLKFDLVALHHCTIT